MHAISQKMQINDQEFFFSPDDTTNCAVNYFDNRLSDSESKRKKCLWVFNSRVL